jgi:hypothetical protein
MSARRKRTLEEEDIAQELFLDSDSDAHDSEDELWSPDSVSDHDSDRESDRDGTRPGDAQWTNTRSWRGAPIIHRFTGDPSGLRQSQAPTVNKHSTPLSVFMLFFLDIIQLLVVETNRYYRQYLDTLKKRRSPLPDVTMQEMYSFLAIILQMGHDIKDTLKAYWSTSEQFSTPFYGKTMKRDRFFHILRFLHFSNNRNEPDKTDNKFDRLWKMRTIFDKLSDAYAKYYSPTEHLAVDEITVLFKGRIVFKQYIPRKHKCFGIKIFKLCDSKGYTYDMREYVGKDRTHATMAGLTKRIRNVGYKLYMDNFFSSPDLFDYLHSKKINCCGTVKLNRKGMPQDLETLKLRRGDIRTRVRVRDNMTVMIWKDKRNVNMLTNMHHPPAEGNFCDEYGNALKPVIIQDYNEHMGYMDKSDRMTNTYSISRRTWKWTKKLFFHLLDLTVLNSYILLDSCGAKLTLRDFRLGLIRDLIQEGGKVLGSQITPQGMPTLSTSRLEAKYVLHWLERGTPRRCRVCSARKKQSRTIYVCPKCNVALCVVPCFKIYHTKSKF